MGLELFTVRDVLAIDFEGTLAKVAEIGYKEVEPASGYNNMSPKDFRALLDRHGLSAPSTHSAGATEGPDMEKQLEGLQIMGIKYAGISAPSAPGGAGGRGGRGPGGGAPPPTASKGGMDDRRQYRLGMGAGSGPLTMGSVQTVDAVKRSAAEANRHGQMAKKFGIKMLHHNHTMEFQPCQGSDLTPEDVFITETDPALVAIQLDIGWASVAGQDIVGLFHKYPGRFELWHVKDATGMTHMTRDMDQNARMLAATVVPIGEGEVDYKTIFSYAGLAGMKHFCVEQDSAAAWGDSIAAARVSYNNLLLDVVA